MKFSILQQDFLPKLQAVSRSAGAHSTLPVLDNILLSVEGKKLKIAATNLEIGVIKYLPVGNGEDGQITVPAKTLVELISGLGQVKIDLEAQGDILTISSGKFKAAINGISASEFPAIPLQSDKSISFPSEALKECSRILFASAVDDGRPVLTGILTDAKADKLDFVATDGFRLAHRQVRLPKNSPQFKSLIPRKTFEEVLRLMAEEDVEKVDISAAESQNQVIFTLGSTIVSSRLIEGQFPQWEKIVPSQSVARVVLEKEEFLRAIKLAGIFSKNEANILVLTAKDKVLKIKSQTKEVGSQENEVDADCEGEIEVAFNTRFLQDAISNAPSSQIMVEFSGPLSASLIKPVGVEGLEYIVMPVRLS